jgi:hypothetical protein
VLSTAQQEHSDTNLGHGSGWTCNSAEAAGNVLQAGLPYAVPFWFKCTTPACASLRWILLHLIQVLPKTL